jgi:hypothetical protein
MHSHALHIHAEHGHAMHTHIDDTYDMHIHVMGDHAVDREESDPDYFLTRIQYL